MTETSEILQGRHAPVVPGRGAMRPISLRLEQEVCAEIAELAEGDYRTWSETARLALIKGLEQLRAERDASARKAVASV